MAKKIINFISGQVNVSILVMLVFPPVQNLNLGHLTLSSDQLSYLVPMNESILEMEMSPDILIFERDSFATLFYVLNVCFIYFWVLIFIWKGVVVDKGK